MSAPEDAPEPGWLCDCGHWQEDDLHCEKCLREPPWGCDCSFCDERYDEDEDEDDCDEDYYPGPWDE